MRMAEILIGGTVTDVTVRTGLYKAEDRAGERWRMVSVYFVGSRQAYPVLLSEAAEVELCGVAGRSEGDLRAELVGQDVVLAVTARVGKYGVELTASTVVEAPTSGARAA